VPVTVSVPEPVPVAVIPTVSDVSVSDSFNDSVQDA